jgi:type I restriction enzyme M protein
LPPGLKKFSKGSPVQDEHFAEARALWERWRAWIDGRGERPFAFAADIRARWQAYREGRGECPEPPYNTWVEQVEDLRARGYDLSARNPHQNDYQTLPHPAEITAGMLERLREVQSALERLHALVTNGGDE